MNEYWKLSSAFHASIETILKVCFLSYYGESCWVSNAKITCTPEWTPLAVMTVLPLRSWIRFADARIPLRNTGLWFLFSSHAVGHIWYHIGLIGAGSPSC